MLTRKILMTSSKRAVLLASLAAMVLTVAEPPLAAAGQFAPTAKGLSATASSDATDFSAARRRRHYRNGGNAAGLAFMGMAIGTIAGLPRSSNGRTITTTTTITATAMRRAITAVGRIMAAAITVIDQNDFR